MEPYKHLVVSVSIGIIGSYYYKNKDIFLVAFIFGTFSDFDHYFEFLYTNGLRTAFDLKDFYSSKHFIKSNRMVLIFHAYEYIILLGIIYFLLPSPIVLIALLTYSSHIFMDAWGNYDLKKISYSIIYRFTVAFSRDKIVEKEYLLVTGKERELIKIRSRSRKSSLD